MRLLSRLEVLHVVHAWCKRVRRQEIAILLLRLLWNLGWNKIVELIWIHCHGLWHLHRLRHWHWHRHLHGLRHAHWHRLRHTKPLRLRRPSLSHILLDHLIIQKHHFFRRQTLTWNISFLLSYIRQFRLLWDKCHDSSPASPLSFDHRALGIYFGFFLLNLLFFLLSPRLKNLEPIFCLFLNFSLWIFKLFEFLRNLLRPLFFINFWLIILLIFWR